MHESTQTRSIQWMTLSRVCAQIAQAYESGGAACISVLTCAKYFQGSFDNLMAIRKAGVTCPLLCKEFVVEVRYAGGLLLLHRFPLMKGLQDKLTSSATSGTDIWLTICIVVVRLALNRTTTRTSAKPV